MSLANTQSRSPTPAVLLPFHTYVKKVFPATCQTEQHWKQKVDIACVELLVVPFNRSFSPHPKIQTYHGVWPASLFVLTLWHIKEPPEIGSQVQITTDLAFRAKSEMMVKHLIFFFLLFGIFPSSSQDTWKTPFIKTMWDDYSHFHSPVMVSLRLVDGHACKNTCATPRLRTRQWKLKKAWVTCVTFFRSFTLSCAAESGRFGCRSGLDSFRRLILFESDSVINIYDFFFRCTLEGTWSRLERVGRCVIDKCWRCTCSAALSLSAFMRVTADVYTPSWRNTFICGLRE